MQEFTVQFWQDFVLFENCKIPLGQISCDVLDLSDETLLQLHEKTNALSRLVCTQLFAEGIQKSLALVAVVQQALKETLEIVFSLPLFCQMDLDQKLYTSMLTSFFKHDQTEFCKAVTQGTSENYALGGFFAKLAKLPDELIAFRAYVAAMLDGYFETLNRRNAEHHAVGVYRFFSDNEIQSLLAKTLPDKPTFIFKQAHNALIEYTTMPNPNDPKQYILAERMVFANIADFFHTDFFRGLMQGNAPRRCHNCGRFFLLQNGYDTCYCSRRAPGKDNRTCRQVGAVKNTVQKRQESGTDRI